MTSYLLNVLLSDFAIIKSNFLKGIMKLSWVHSISRPVEPSRLEPQSHLGKPVRRGITRWSICGWMSPSGFIKSVLDVCPVWDAFSVFVLRFSAEINLRTIWRRQLLLITTPCRQSDLVSSTTVVYGLSFGAVAILYSKGSTQGWGSPES